MIRSNSNKIKLFIWKERLYKKLTVVFEISCVILLWRKYSIVSSRHDLTEECTNVLHLDDLERNNTLLSYELNWAVFHKPSLYHHRLQQWLYRIQDRRFRPDESHVRCQGPKLFFHHPWCPKTSNTDEHTNLINRKYSNASAKVAYRQPSDFIFCRVAFVVTWITKWRHSNREPLVGCNCGWVRRCHFAFVYKISLIVFYKYDRSYYH